MKKALVVCGVVSMAFTPTLALAKAPVELNADQMDRITAGDLVLPNGKEVFDNFDNPGKGGSSGFGACNGLGLHPDGTGGDADTACHPALSNRSMQGLVSSGYNDGPWQAAVHSPVITCATDLTFPVGTELPDGTVTYENFPCPVGSF